MLANRPELLQAEYALNEGGGRVESDRKISNDVQASEKKVSNFTLEATNPGGHSSVPRPVQRQLVAAVQDTSVHVTMIREARDSPPSPLTPDLLRTIEETTNEVWPGIPVVPTMSTGATDGSYLRSAGIPVYGVSGLFYEGANAHGMNENISSQAFYEGLDFMYRLVKKLATGPGM